MGFYEFDINESGGISKDYFNNRAEAILSELTEINPKYIGSSGARFYSILYAEARRQEAKQNIDICSNKSEREKWTDKHDRWHKVILQFESGNLTLLSKELEKDRLQYLRLAKSETEARALGHVLKFLSEKIRDSTQRS